MPAIDRVMKAYTSRHQLSPEQAALVRAELSKFISELMAVNAAVKDACGSSGTPTQLSCDRTSPTMWQNPAAGRVGVAPAGFSFKI